MRITSNRRATAIVLMIMAGFLDVWIETNALNAVRKHIRLRLHLRKINW